MLRRHKKLIRRVVIAGAALLVAAIVTLAVRYFSHVSVDVLQPKGTIASQEYGLMMITLGLSAIVVIPVFFMLWFFAWKYRESNHKARYMPEWDGNRWLEIVWWGIPCAIIGVLGTLAWQTSHSLDPYRPITSTVQPVRVQVVALQWRWLFIYPDYGIATMNNLSFPEKAPLNFTITSDAPMNSFWIPSLGSQVYAMSGMSSQLHLMADAVGDYKGSSTNISGKGYADMSFTAHSLTAADFAAWVKTVKTTGGTLDAGRYAQLAQPSEQTDVQYFSLADTDLYTSVLMKYMAPSSGGQHAMEGM